MKCSTSKASLVAAWSFSKIPIWVGAPNAASSGPTGRKRTTMPQFSDDVTVGPGIEVIVDSDDAEPAGVRVQQNR